MVARSLCKSGKALSGQDGLGELVRYPSDRPPGYTAQSAARPDRAPPAGGPFCAPRRTRRVDSARREGSRAAPVTARARREQGHRSRRSRAPRRVVALVSVPRRRSAASARRHTGTWLAETPVHGHLRRNAARAARKLAGRLVAPQSRRSALGEHIRASPRTARVRLRIVQLLRQHRWRQVARDGKRGFRPNVRRCRRR